MSVPVSVQFPIFLKIFGFDRNLNRLGKKINIYIIYQSNYRASLNTKNDIINTVNSQKLNYTGGLPISYIPVDISNENIDGFFEKNIPGIAYFCPLRAADIRNMTQLCKNKKMISMTGVTSYTKEGVSLTIDRKGDKPEIVINLASAKSEGSDFSSQLLKLSTIID